MKDNQRTDYAMRRLNGQVQHFAWGSVADIPGILRREPDGLPWAEYWLGTHPNGPSTLEDGATLSDLITQTRRSSARPAAPSSAPGSPTS